MLPAHIMDAVTVINKNEKEKVTLKSKLTEVKASYPSQASEQLREALGKYMSDYVNTRLGTDVKVSFGWGWNCKLKTKQPFKIVGINIEYNGEVYSLRDKTSFLLLNVWQGSGPMQFISTVNGVKASDYAKCLEEFAKAEKFYISI